MVEIAVAAQDRAEGLSQPLPVQQPTYYPQQSPRPPDLSQILVGNWSVELSLPRQYGSVTQITTLTPQGQFSGRELERPRFLNGTWWISGSNNITVDVMDSMHGPYRTIITFDSIGPVLLHGVGSFFGANQIWRRMG
jgi:hypothetical protein